MWCVSCTWESAFWTTKIHLCAHALVVLLLLCCVVDVIAVVVAVVAAIVAVLQLWLWLLALAVLQYLLLSAMEFARIVLLTPHLHERFEVPGVALSRYEMFQVVVLVLEEVVFVVRSCGLLLLLL